MIVAAVTDDVQMNELRKLLAGMNKIVGHADPYNSLGI